MAGKMIGTRKFRFGPTATLMPGHAPLSFHPFANLFPMLADDRRPAFRESLAEEQLHPITLHRGMVIDGRNRYRELSDLKKPISYRIFEGSDHDALGFVAAENLDRRDLTDHDRKRIASKISSLRLGTNRFTRVAPPNGGASFDLSEAAPPQEDVLPPLSAAERAALMNVPLRSVERSDAIDAKGTPELIAAVDKREIEISTGEAIARRPVEEQKAILEALPRDAAGKLTPEAKKEVRKVAKEVRAEDQAAKKEKRAAKEQKLGTAIAAKGKFGVVLEDFEWDHKPYSRETGMDRHPSNHYPTAADAHTPEEIVARTAERFECAADDCVLYMWTTIPHSAIAYDVLKLRGFTYKSQRVWDKVRTGDGRGPGYWVTGEHEIQIIATRGNVVAPFPAHFPSRFEAPVGAHSEKPDQQYEHAEYHFPNTPKIELNARRAREGWIQWGNEAQPSLALQSEEEAA